MTVEEIEKLMLSILSNDVMEEVDEDSVRDSDYVCDEITPKDTAMINCCLEHLKTTALLNAVIFSSITINDRPLQYAPLATTAALAESTPPTRITCLCSKNRHHTNSSHHNIFQVTEKTRSPLPVIEDSGPQAVPSAGAFTLLFSKIIALTVYLLILLY